MDKNQLSRTLNEYYEKGISALDKGNYDYAIEMLLQVVHENPRFYEARKKLHFAEREKAKDTPSSIMNKISNKMNAIIPFILAFYYEIANQSSKAIAFYEDLLKTDPFNKLYLKKIQQIAAKTDWVEVSIAAAESIFELEPDNASLAAEIGRMYRDLHNIEKASFFLRRSLEIRPHDQQTSKMLKDIEALHTIQKGGWDKNGDYRSKIKNESEAAALEKESNFTQDEKARIEMISQMKSSLESTPTDEHLWGRLLDQLLKLERPDDALKETETALKFNPESEIILKRIELATKLKHKLKIDEIKSKIKTNGESQELRSKLSEAEKALLKFELNTLELKVKQYPNNLPLKYEYAEALFNSAEYDQAIAEYQQALKDPSLSVKALNQLGLCFHNKKMFDLALLQYRKALDKVPGINETSKEIIYNHGLTLEAMNNMQAAIEEYKRIYEADISYKDVAKRIEDYYKKEQSS